jgi:excisionase family DNA binding protein
MRAPTIGVSRKCIFQQSMPLAERAALRLRGPAEDYSGLGVTTLYELAAAGKIKMVKAGGRTLVVRSSIDSYLASLAPK